MHAAADGRDDLRRLFEEVSNAGRWGPDDELGTLNYISAESRVEATQLVRRGRVASIAFDLDYLPTRKNRRPSTLDILHRGDDAQVAIDRLDVVAHSVTVTHLDALTHVYFEGRAWNGRERAAILDSRGLSYASILAMRDGIMTRGVLLDIAAARGVPWLSPTDEVGVADLDAAEALAGRRVSRGDAVLVRVGLGAREAVEGPEDPATRAGLAPDCLRWFHDREIALFGGDCFDKLPSTIPGVTHPLHAVALAAMGLAMLDNVDTELLADVCRQEQRNDFLFVAAPLRVPGGTGSPVNPLCIF